MVSVFYNCLVRTMDPVCPIAEAVTAENGVITYVGTKEEALSRAGETADRIDLHGAVMVPGLIDSHMHMLYTAFFRTKTDLSSCTSFSETMALLQAKAEAMKDKPGAWLCAVGFNQDTWSDRKELPTRLELDAAVGSVPCFITRVCGHIAVYNTRALEILGIMSGEYDRTVSLFPDGTPDGRVYEADFQPGDRFLPAPGIEEYKKWIVEESLRCAAAGLTAVHSDDLNLVSPGKDAGTVMEAYRELGLGGRLPIRVFEQCRIEEENAIRSFAAAYPAGTEFGRFRTVSVKQMMDGSLGARSAFMRRHDGSDADNGIAIHSDEEINGLVLTANSCGYPVVAHCIGDGAVEQLLNAFSSAKAALGDSGLRNGVVHCQIMGTDQLERMAENDVLAYVQPVFVRADSAIVEKIVGRDIALQSYNWRKMLELGIHVSCGTDSPVESNDPIANIYYAVTRTGSDGKPWIPENGMTAEEALRAYTIEGAYAAGMEDKLGSISVGKYADFTVLDRDIIRVAPEEIKNISVIMTVVGGEQVYLRRETV